MWRCLNDYLGYCNGEPEYETEPVGIGPESKIMADGICKLDPKTCDKYLTNNMKLALEGIEIQPPHEEKEEAVATTKTKPKTQPKKQKLQQMNMFDL